MSEDAKTIEAAFETARAARESNLCPSCHHRAGRGNNCYCDCHVIADAAPALLAACEGLVESFIVTGGVTAVCKRCGYVAATRDAIAHPDGCPVGIAERAIASAREVTP